MLLFMNRLELMQLPESHIDATVSLSSMLELRGRTCELTLIVYTFSSECVNSITVRLIYTHIFHTHVSHSDTQTFNCRNVKKKNTYLGAGLTMTLNRIATQIRGHLI